MLVHDSERNVVVAIDDGAVLERHFGRVDRLRRVDQLSGRAAANEKRAPLGIEMADRAPERGLARFKLLADIA